MKQIDKIKKVQTIGNNVKSKHIVISEINYLRLREYGKLGDTYDDVLTALLEKAKKSDVSCNLKLDSDWLPNLGSE